MKVFSSNEEERRKQITTHLFSGGGPYLYDNISGENIDSDVLSSVLTSTAYADRLLGGNTEAKLENLGPWIATGNNPKFSGQLSRRVIRARIVPNTDEPYLRDNFRHDPLIKWVEENRAELVQACITIVMSWVDADRPAWHGQPLGSFEEFSKVMGGILANAGVHDFMTDMAFQKDSVDSETEQTRELMQALWKEYCDDNIRLKEIVAIADHDGLDIQDHWFDMNDRAQSTKAGKYMKTLIDRFFTIENDVERFTVQLTVGSTRGTYRLKPKDPSD
jgi:hypothetical protein